MNIRLIVVGLAAVIGGAYGYSTWLAPLLLSVPNYVFHLAGWCWVLWGGWFLVRRLSR